MVLEDLFLLLRVFTHPQPVHPYLYPSTTRPPISIPIHNPSTHIYTHPQPVHPYLYPSTTRPPISIPIHNPSTHIYTHPQPVHPYLYPSTTRPPISIPIHNPSTHIYTHPQQFLPVQRVDWSLHKTMPLTITLIVCQTPGRVGTDHYVYSVPRLDTGITVTSSGSYLKKFMFGKRSIPETVKMFKTTHR